MTADLHAQLLHRLDELDAWSVDDWAAPDGANLHRDLGQMRAALRAVVEQAHAWSRLAPPDDWGDTPGQTAVADAGRHLQRLIAEQLGLTEGTSDAVTPVGHNPIEQP